MRASLTAAVLAGLLAISDPPEASQPGADTGPLPIAQIDKIVVGGTPKLEPAASEVRVIRAQQIVAARPALQLFEHDEILTGPDVTVTILCLEEVAEEDKTVFVGAASQIRVRSQRSIFLILGRILANVRGRFDVATARATLGSRSTEFEVRVGEDGATHLLVLEGVVDVQRTEEPPAAQRQPAGRQFGPILVRAAFSAQKLPQPAAVGRLEEVTIQKSDPTTKVNDTTEDRVRGALGWTTDAAIAGQPATAPKRVVPHFESPDDRARAYRQARFDAVWKQQPGSYETLGKVYSDWEKGAKAVEAFGREVEINPSQQKSGSFLAGVGEALRMKGRLKEAEEQLLKATRTDPGNARALNGLGNVYFAQAAAAEDHGNLDAATGLLQRCLKIYAESRQSRLDTGTASGVGWANDGESKLALGDIARQQNRLEEAEARYKEGRDAFVRASGADPRYLFAAVGVADSTRRIGSVARRRGSEDQARSAFRQAESEYRKILETHPTLSAAHLGLGDLYIETGARKEAIASYTRALVLRPDQPAAHLRLGIALAEENPRAAALHAKTYMAIEQQPLKEGQRMSVARNIATASPLRATPDKPGPEIPPGPPRAVPKVEGMLQEPAAVRLREHGFRVGKIDRKESSQNPGTVLDQEPEGGKKAAGGTAVDLEVAIPRGTTVEVPDVVGDSRDRAIQKLRDKRLTVAQPITYQASCEEAGKVLRQDPDEDARVPAGTAVALVVASTGTEPVRVPRLVGVRLADADRASRERRFKIGRVERRPTNQYAPDTIFGQSPKADTLVAPDCPIDVVVAVEIQQIAVPSLISMTEAAARHELQRFGLGVGQIAYRQVRGTPGEVVEQFPPAGTLVEPGTRINVAVIAQRQTPPPPPPTDNLVDVPSVQGWPRSNAVATLQKLGLRVEVKYQDVPLPATRAARVPKNDEVLSQSHVGPVRRGTTIQLTVARVQQPIR